MLQRLAVVRSSSVEESVLAAVHMGSGDGDGNMDDGNIGTEGDQAHGESHRGGMDSI